MITDRLILDAISKATSVRNVPYTPSDCWGENWGREQWRAPSIEASETVLAELPGRVIPGGVTGGGVCYRSYYLRVLMVEGREDAVLIRVKHGAGEEVFTIPTRLLNFLWLMDDDEQYMHVYSLYRVLSDLRLNAGREVGKKWQRAIIEKRVRIRRKRGQKSVEIEQPPAGAVEPSPLAHDPDPIEVAPKQHKRDGCAQTHVAVVMHAGEIPAFV